MHTESHAGLTKDFSTMNENGAWLQDYLREDIELRRLWKLVDYRQRASRFAKIAGDICKNK